MAGRNEVETGVHGDGGDSRARPGRRALHPGRWRALEEQHRETEDREQAGEDETETADDRTGGSAHGPRAVDRHLGRGRSGQQVRRGDAVLELVGGEPAPPRDADLAQHPHVRRRSAETEHTDAEPLACDDGETRVRGDGLRGFHAHSVLHERPLFKSRVSTDGLKTAIRGVEHRGMEQPRSELTDDYAVHVDRQLVRRVMQAGGSDQLPPSNTFAFTASAPGIVQTNLDTGPDLFVRLERWSGPPPPAGDEWDASDDLPWQELPDGGLLRVEGDERVNGLFVTGLVARGCPSSRRPVATKRRAGCCGSIPTRTAATR